MNRIVPAGGEGRRRSPLAVFRADASESIGAGHVFRCLALSEELRRRNWRCVLLSSPEVFATVPQQRLNGVDVVEIDGAARFDAARCAEAIGDFADLVVVDHYGLAVDFETGCRAWSRMVMAIDDQPGRAHDCDLLLDQTFARQSSEYRQVVPAAASICTGTSFALLAAEFSRQRPMSLQRRPGTEAAHRVFIGIGATDPMSLSAGVAEEILAARPDVSIVIVLSSAAAGFAKVAELAASNANVRLLADALPEAVVREMQAADVAVGAAGTGTWERCCLGLPSVMVVVADNQKDIAQAIAEAGAADVLGNVGGLAAGAFGEAVVALLTDDRRRKVMSERAASICDGTGAARVADMVESRLRQLSPG